jgi:mevalonate kinase
VWVDPQSNLIYIFLSNRVYNTRSNNLLAQLGVRGKIQDAIYKALKKEAEAAAIAAGAGGGEATTGTPADKSHEDKELQNQYKEIENQLLFD